MHEYHSDSEEFEFTRGPVVAKPQLTQSEKACPPEIENQNSTPASSQPSQSVMSNPPDVEMRDSVPVGPEIIRSMKPNPPGKTRCKKAKKKDPANS
jgi:hypothetical protein